VRRAPPSRDAPPVWRQRISVCGWKCSGSAAALASASAGAAAGCVAAPGYEPLGSGRARGTL